MRKRKQNVRGFLVSLPAILLLICGPLSAAEFRATDLNVMTEDFPPYNYIDEKTGALTGFSTEIAAEIMTDLKIDPEIHVLPWKRAYHKIQTENRSMLFSMSRTPERENMFEWIGPIIEFNVCFYAKKNAGLKIESLEDASKVKSIGVAENTSGHILLKKIGFKNIEAVANGDLNPEKLLSGRITLWLGSDIGGKYLLKSLGMDFDSFEQLYTVRREQLYFAFSKDTPPEVLKKWYGSLDAIKKDGRYDAVYQKYFSGENSTERTVAGEPPSR